MLAYSGWPYDQGWRYGMGRSAEDFEQQWWPRVEQRLEEIDYPLPMVMVQSFHPFGDNGSAFGGFSRWIDEWNATGKGPQIQFATPRMWWAAVKTHLDKLPTHRGDWTDFWNFGCASSAREQTINRQSRTRLRTADAIAAAVQALPAAQADPWLERSLALYRTEAWDNLIFWDEHTWGADISIRNPDGDDTATQWNEKANFAYRARSLSLMLQRDALAALARVVEASGDDLLLVNPLPWSRTLAAEAPPSVLQPRGTADDDTAGCHFQDHHPFATSAPLSTTLKLEDLSAKRTAVPPVTVPAYGYTVVRRADLVEYAITDKVTEDAVVETARYRLTFDRERGGIVGFYDHTLQHEWVDPAAGYPLHGFVHEEVMDRASPWPRYRLFYMKWDSASVERDRGWKPGWRALRRTPSRVLSHNVIHTPLGIEIVQTLEAPGVVGPLVQSVFLPNYADYVECRAQWRMGLDDHPEATYLVFPFQVAHAATRFDLGPQPVRPELDQLPGVCRDCFTVQNWVDFSNDQLGMTIATPDNPMVQFGDFHFGSNQNEFRLERPSLLGWVTNTYWETNFRAHQPGLVTTRYRLQPHAGGFDEAAVHRFGLEAANDAPLLQQLGEPKGAGNWPASGALLELPQPPVIVLHVKPAADGAGVIVRLLNASDTEQTARLGSGLVRIVGAEACDLLEQPTGVLAVSDGSVTVSVPARRIVVMKLQTA